MLPDHSDMHFTVKGTECGPEERLFLHVLLGDLQETADKGASDCGFDRYVIKEAGACWIILRMEVEIIRLPSWREDFMIRTWSTGVEKFFFDREYEVFDNDGNVIARGTSTWILANVDTHFPLIPSKLESLPHEYVQNDRLVFGHMAGRLKAPARETFAREPDIIKFSDHSELDHNRHVNNTRYVAWAIDALYKNGIDLKSLHSISVTYIAEVKAGEKVELFATETAPDRMSVYGYKNGGEGVFAMEVAL